MTHDERRTVVAFTGPPLPFDALHASLAAALRLSPNALIVDRITELSPGLSGARLFRLAIQAAKHAADASDGGNLPTSVILKIPDWGAPTSVRPQDRWVSTREIHFYASGLASRLPERLRAPALVGIDRRSSHTWLWTEDVGVALQVCWGPARAVEAARRVATLHRLYLAERPHLHALSWLEREGYAAHTHHVPAGHAHLDKAARHPRWSRLFTTQERKTLHHALDCTSWAVEQMRQLPLTLVHGDFHLANLGFDAADALVAIDWAHVGVAPIGCDVATLISLYTDMGGQGDMKSGGVLEGETIAAYCNQLAHETGQDAAALRHAVNRACGLWHLTWGLHLRLGPGLDWLLRRPDQDSAEASQQATGIHDGCHRALAFLASV